MADDYYLSTDPSVAPNQSQIEPAASSPSKTDPNQISAWYQQYLGRAPESTAVVNAWAGQDAQTAQLGIENSAEAQAYRAKQAAPAAPAASAAAAAASQAGPAAPARSSFAFQAPPPTTDPTYTRMVQALVGRALSQPTTSPDDPNVQASTSAYAADQTRASRDALSSLAEKGGSHMNLDAATLAAGEKAGQNTAGFRAALVQKNLDAERAAVTQALSGASGLLTAQQTAALQQRAQELDAAAFNASTAQQGWQDQYQSIFG